MKASGVPVRLLLVEDSENDAMLLLRELERGGYEPDHERVYTPEDMRRALEEADAGGKPYEIVISHYYMPRFRARDALELLRKFGHDVPFIVVSGKIGEDATVRIMKAGANDYLTKENMARLCPAIARELKEAGIRRERAEAEEALAQSEERFRRLVEQAADAVFVHDLKGNLLDVNRRACESLGYSKKELLGMNVAEVEVGSNAFDLIHPDDRARVAGVFTAYRDRSDPFPLVEYRVVDKGGAWRRFEAIGENLLHDPVIRGVVMNSRDVTERPRTEEALRQSEELLRTVVTNAPLSCSPSTQKESLPSPPGAGFSS